MGPPFIFFFYFGVFGDLILGAVKRHNLRRRATLLPTFVLRSGSLCVWVEQEPYDKKIQHISFRLVKKVDKKGQN